ncbi:MAG: outer membrane lipoprotein carrier protein LolA [Verrucomicrobiota bacterium]
MKRLLCLCLPLLSAVAFAAEPCLTPPERAELLARLQAVHEKSPYLSATFSEQRTSHLLKNPVTSGGTIAFQIPNKFRREVTGSNPSLTVSNGHQLWIYYPNFQEVEEYTLGQRAMFDDAMAALTAGLNFARVEAFYNLDATRDDGGFQLTLTPKRGNIKRIVQQLAVFLDKNLEVRRTDLMLPKGDRVITTYTNPRHAPLPASTFEFTPPTGAHVTHPLGK